MAQGKTLGGYEIIERVGQGPLGAVYRARQIAMDRLAAVRVVPDALARDADYAKRFVDRARAAAACSHTNLLQIYEAGYANGRYFCATEFAAGPTLLQVLAESGTLEEGTALDWMCQIAGALREAHRRGVVHGDVKPGNIFLTESREPRLADLAVARPPKGPANPTGAISPHYEAPEIARGGPIDARADLYALGATFFHMVAGTPVFRGETPEAIMSAHSSQPPTPIRTVAPRASQAFEGVLLTLLAKDPAGRHASADDLIEDLHAVKAGTLPMNVKVTAADVASPDIAVSVWDPLPSAPAPSAARGPLGVQPEGVLVLKAPGERPPEPEKIEVTLAAPEPPAPRAPRAPAAAARPFGRRLDVPPGLLVPERRRGIEWGKWIKLALACMTLAGIAAFLMWKRRQPSEELVRARELKERVVQLRKAGEREKAFKAASKLARASSESSKKTEFAEFDELAKWGTLRAEEINAEIGLAAVADLRVRLEAPGTASQSALISIRSSLAVVGQRYSSSPEVVAKVKELAAEIADRLREVKALAEQEKRKKVARSAGDVLAKVRGEVEALLQVDEFAAAGQVLAKALSRARRARAPGLVADLEKLSPVIREAAIKHWDKEDGNARALITAGRYAEARTIYKHAVHRYGIADISELARKALASSAQRIRRAAVAAQAERVDRKLRHEALSLAAELCCNFAYAKAVAALEEALASAKDAAVKAELSLAAEVARRELAVMSAIIKMVNAKPVDLKRLKAKSYGRMYKADERGYRVRVRLGGGGETLSEKSWDQLPAEDLCKLAEAAVGRTREAAIDVALLCARHGAKSQRDAAVARVLESKDEKFVGLVARYVSYLTDAAELAMGSGELPEGTSGAEGAVDAANQPKTIEVGCPVCRGSGVIKEIGCAHCSGMGYVGIERCGPCGGRGVKEYKCPGCRGHKVVILRAGGERECRICQGKGYSSCPACRGLGKIERPNPKASGKPTRECKNCNGTGFQQNVSCKRCSAKGTINVSTVRGDVIYYMDVRCRLCGGDGEGPPVCRRCGGRGSTGPNTAPRPCPGCYGTGHGFIRCVVCKGRGWYHSGK